MSKKIPLDLITQAEAARIRGVSPEAIASLVRRGRLASYNIAGRVHVRKSEVEGFEKKSPGRPSKAKATKKTASKPKSTKKSKG